MQKKPWLAALISLIYPGLGHIYIGKTFYGITFVLIASVWLIYNFNIHSNNIYLLFALSIGLWTSAAMGAYMRAIQFNLENKPPKRTSKCPQCLDEITPLAAECPTCGKDLSKVLLFNDGSEGIIDRPDVEINQQTIIEYKKGWMGKRNGKTKTIPLDRVKSATLKKLNGYIALDLVYIDPDELKKTKQLVLNGHTLNKLKEILDNHEIPYKT